LGFFEANGKRFPKCEKGRQSPKKAEYQRLAKKKRALWDEKKISGFGAPPEKFTGFSQRPKARRI
jgi:hypothetical protein